MQKESSLSLYISQEVHEVSIGLGIT